MSGLIVEDLHFSRDGRAILRGVNFTHEPGRVLTILGPSGSGKTTLLWLIAGLLTPAAGRISTSGDTRVGFVFQDGGLWEHLTVGGHLDVVLRGLALNSSERAGRISRTLAETGLAALARRRPGELSGGERQRLSLARALVVEPQWMLLDEPTSQLDGPARQALVELLEQRLRNSGAGVILATHQVDLALRLSDRIAVLLDGQIAQLGTPQEVYERPVSLAVARLTGPAFEMSVGGVARVLRPHHCRFQQANDGPFTVRGSHFAGGRWLVDAEDERTHAVVESATPFDIGTRGTVHVLA